MSEDTAAGLATPEDELLVRLGAELLGAPIGVTGRDRDRNRRFAARWLEQWLRDYREAICSDPRVVALLAGGEHATSVEEYAVIYDVLSALIGGPPVATVARILTKRGLARVCET